MTDCGAGNVQLCTILPVEVTCLLVSVKDSAAFIFHAEANGACCRPSRGQTASYRQPGEDSERKDSCVVYGQRAFITPGTGTTLIDFLRGI